jgi:hypothetical protein
LRRHWQFVGTKIGLWRGNKRALNRSDGVIASSISPLMSTVRAPEIDVPGVCLFDGNFCKRKQLYVTFDCDGEINQYTDFFGAAAMTCDMLDWLDTSMGRDMAEICAETHEWLEAMSGALEIWNREMADKIRRREAASQIRAELNQSLVRMEQKLVQDAIDKLKSERPEDAEIIISRLSKLLNGGWAHDYGLGKFVLGSFGPAISLALSRKGASLDYGCYEDRVLIGDCAVQLAPTTREDYLLR